MADITDSRAGGRGLAQVQGQMPQSAGPTVPNSTCYPFLSGLSWSGLLLQVQPASISQETWLTAV